MLCGLTQKLRHSHWHLARNAMVTVEPHKHRNTDRRGGCCLQRFVRRINHVLRFISGLNAANTPNTRPMVTKATSAASQLRSRYHGRKAQVEETSEAAGQVEAQTQREKTSTAATNPPIKPTIKPFLKFGYMMCSIRLTSELRHSHGNAAPTEILEILFHKIVN